MIADNIPEIGQARRLGHHLSNRIVETYSHVAPEVERRLLRALEHRWQQATSPTSAGHRPLHAAPHIDPGRDSRTEQHRTPLSTSPIGPTRPARSLPVVLQMTPEFLQAG